MLIQKTRSLAVALALLPLMAGATTSKETLPVVGQGGPLAPTVTLDQPLKVGRASTATAAGYSDPDSDPLASWEYQWRDAANGAGALLGSGASYTPTDTNAVYLRSRALAARGYPAVQKEGVWAEQNLVPIADVVVGIKCTSGSSLTSGGLSWTCPLTTAEASAAGISYQGNTSELGNIWIRMNWATANAYCQDQGYRLPTEPELSALYSAQGNMSNTYGWPTIGYYWSSTEHSVGRYYYVYLLHGVVGNTDNSNHAYVTCVR